MLVIVNDHNVAEVFDVDNTIVVKFGANWCAPCKAFAPIFEELANERTDILFADCDIDEASSLAALYGVRKVPTVILIKDGQHKEYKGNLLPSAFRKWVEFYA